MPFSWIAVYLILLSKYYVRFCAILVNKKQLFLNENSEGITEFFLVLFNFVNKYLTVVSRQFFPRKTLILNIFAIQEYIPNTFKHIIEQNKQTFSFRLNKLLNTKWLRNNAPKKNHLSKIIIETTFIGFKIPLF